MAWHSTTELAESGKTETPDLSARLSFTQIPYNSELLKGLQGTKR